MKVLKWITGIFFLIGGIGMFAETIRVAILGMLLGLFILPPTHRLILTKANLNLNRTIKWGIAIGLFLVMGVFINLSNLEKERDTDKLTTTVKETINPSNVIIEAVNLNFNDLKDIEKKDMIFTQCCCYPKNWNQGVNCVEKEEAFYVKAKINIDLLATLSVSEAFTKNDLITSNPHSLYGKYHNRWGFIDENGNEICETAKFDGHHSFNIVRKGNIDEITIGPLPIKPSKMIIEISDSKYYEGITPEKIIKN